MNNPNPAPISDLSPVDPRVQPAGAAAGAVEGRPTSSSETLERQAMRDDVTGCLVWRGAVRQNGYGQLRLRGKTHKSHRLAYETWVGPIPVGAAVCHTCDNRLCIEPTHLFLGSYTDNNRDRDTKGRQANGERQGHSKLTEADVRAIRASSASNQALAAEYGVFHTAIWKARTGRSWAHIKAEPQADLSGEVERGGNSRLDTSSVVEGAPYIEMPDGQKFLAVGWAMLSPFAQGYAEAVCRAAEDTLGGFTASGVRFSDLTPEALAMILRDCETRRGLMGTNSKQLGGWFWERRQAGEYEALAPLRVYLNADGKVALEVRQ